MLRQLIQDYTWVRLAALTRLRRHRDAVELLATVSLRPDDPQRLTTWAQVTAYRGLEADDVQMLLACIDEIQPDPELTAWLLRLAWESYTLGDAARRIAAKAAARAAGAEVDDLADDPEDDTSDEAVLATPEGRAGRALYDALERHQAEHGKIPGFDALQVGEGEAGIENLIADLTAMLRSQAERLDTAIKHVLAGQPLGLVAVAANRPYARAVIGRVIGYLPAVSHDESAFEAEVQAAAAALGGAVAVEASTLHTVDRLDRDSLTGNFAELLLSQRARDDITSGLLANRADLAASGHIGFDRVQGRFTRSEGRDPDADLLVARARRLEELAAFCRIVPVDVEHYGPDSELFRARDATADSADEDVVAQDGDAKDEDIDDAHEVDPVARAAAMGPWLDAVEVAADMALPLWSDDLGLRRLAAARGVASFSTAALLEALLDEMRLPEGEVPGLRARLLRAGVADLNVTDDELGAMVAEAAALRDTDPAAVRELVTAVGMKLSRPSYAEVRQTTFLGDVRQLIVLARVYEDGWAETFCFQALTGLVLRGLTGDGVLRAALELSFGGTPGVDARRTARYLELARRVVIAHHDQDPIADLPSMMETSLPDVVGKDDFVARVLEELLPTAETAIRPAETNGDAASGDAENPEVA